MSLKIRFGYTLMLKLLMLENITDRIRLEAAERPPIDIYPPVRRVTPENTTTIKPSSLLIGVSATDAEDLRHRDTYKIETKRFSPPRAGKIYI